MKLYFTHLAVAPPSPDASQAASSSHVSFRCSRTTLTQHNTRENTANYNCAHTTCRAALSTALPTLIVREIQKILLITIDTSWLPVTPIIRSGDSVTTCSQLRMRYNSSI